MSTIIYTIPDLGIEEKLRERGFKENYIKKHVCKYHYIIHLLLKKYKRNGRFEDYGYARISTSFIKELLGKARYIDKPYPDWIVFRAVRHLEDFGIIKTKRYYKDQNDRVLKCKIPNQLYQRGSIVYEGFVEPLFQERLKCNKPVIPEKYKPIENLFRKVMLDKKAAQYKLNEMIENMYQTDRAKRNEFNKVVKPIMEMDSERAQNWQSKIDNFNKFWFNVDLRNGNRTYSNATNFPKDLRCYNYLKGHENKPLWELDIKNCQPLLLSIVVMDYYRELGMVIPDDVIRYKTLCETGNFVNYFRDELNNAGIKNEETLKTDLFARIFFNKESQNRTYLFKKKFDELFPSVGICISTLKKLGDGDEPHKNVSKKLTEVESGIMIERVSMKLIELGVEFFPIHDAIYTIEDYTKTVHKVILEEFQSYGIVPSVRKKKVLPVQVISLKESNL